MGGGVSTSYSSECFEKKQKQHRKIIDRIETFVDVDDDDDEIDINDLYSALLKLSGIFEMDESLPRSLVKTIEDPAHETFDSQLFAVAKWIWRHDDDTNINALEMAALITYVDLFSSTKGECCEDEGECCLVCPKRCEVLSTFTGKVRSLEAMMYSSGRKARFSKNEQSDGIRSCRLKVQCAVEDFEHNNI